MCGIAGIVMRDGSAPDPGVLDAFESALAHRGPDGCGRHVDGDVGLLQTRLAIIDLKTGDQPLHARGPSGGLITLVANGEIYNYRELRQDLDTAPFVTESDCETPLYLYLRDGVDFARSLRGMYAIAIHDPQTDRLILSRDPFGIKPLYFVETQQIFAFASEAQALVKAGLVTPQVDTMKAQELLQLQFTTGAGTPFAGIQRVLPGETLVVRAGRIIERHRLSPLPSAERQSIPPDRALNEMMSVLQGSVEMHQRSDVPYGMFLSGGIDSSALIAMMDRLNDKPVQAFTIGFGDGVKVPDERAHAQAVAKAAHADHTEVFFGESDFWSLLPKAAAVMDDPVADYAVLPTLKLAAAVRDAGLKVILSGEGGDEMFAGYGRYRRAARPRLLGGRPMRHQGMLSGLGVMREDTVAWRNGMQSAEKALPDGLSGIQRAQALDCADWLPNDLLTKVDRCLMAYGIEGRVPFLDRELAAFAFPLLDKLKVRRRMGKWLLRKWLETALPESQPFTKKRGFTVPIGPWLEAKGDKLGPLVAGQPGIEQLCHRNSTAALFRAKGKRETQAQWVLLFYALWHQHHIVGKPADGDAFDMLAA
jgi:asparagine synthase (glutamine-hydrolysing)